MKLGSPGGGSFTLEIQMGGGSTVFQNPGQKGGGGGSENHALRWGRGAFFLK